MDEVRRTGKKSWHELMKEATEKELLDELARRRQDAIRASSDEEIENELKERGVDIDSYSLRHNYGRPIVTGELSPPLPKRVEK